MAKRKIKPYESEVNKSRCVDKEWYSIRSLLGYNWAEMFVLLGGREAG